MLNLFRIKKSSKGFTLIELLVVIAIIGVLASIVLASLANARRKSRDARRITDLKQLQLANELYFDGAGIGQYALSTATCSATPGTGDDENRGLQALANKGYIPTVPRDPLRTGAPDTNGCYAYATASSPTRTAYHIGASLEDTGNPALASDRDCNSSIPNGGCPLDSVAYTNGFNGGSGTPETGGACTNASLTAYRCYDLVP